LSFDPLIPSIIIEVSEVEFMAKPPELLRETLEKEKDRMFRIAWKMCGNPEDANEVLQETALKALKNWHQFRGESQISTWLYRIASNTCISKQRKKSQENQNQEELNDVPRDSVGSHMPVIPDWSQDPLAQTLNEELRRALDKAIMKLPESHRMVFLMRDIEGMSGEETAQALAITETNVKVRLHRARIFLRDELAEFIKSSKRGPQ
jgi:RNA polymerase sigma-70 factor, ECF subfamily